MPRYGVPASDISEPGQDSSWQVSHGWRNSSRDCFCSSFELSYAIRRSRETLPKIPYDLIRGKLIACPKVRFSDEGQIPKRWIPADHDVEHRDLASPPPFFESEVSRELFLFTIRLPPGQFKPSRQLKKQFPQQRCDLQSPGQSQYRGAIAGLRNRLRQRCPR